MVKTTIYFDEELHDRVLEMSEKEMRSFTKQVTFLVRLGLQPNGKPLQEKPNEKD
jgi:hypothetical protein